MVITTKEMYSEVYGILQALGEKYINKLSDYMFDSRNEKGKILTFIENGEINFRREG